MDGGGVREVFSGRGRHLPAAAHKYEVGPLLKHCEAAGATRVRKSGGFSSPRNECPPRRQKFEIDNSEIARELENEGSWGIAESDCYEEAEGYALFVEITSETST